MIKGRGKICCYLVFWYGVIIDGNGYEVDLGLKGCIYEEYDED